MALFCDGMRNSGINWCYSMFGFLCGILKLWLEQKLPEKIFCSNYSLEFFKQKSKHAISLLCIFYGNRHSCLNSDVGYIIQATREKRNPSYKMVLKLEEEKELRRSTVLQS